jgi:hypothetical protein
VNEQATALRAILDAAPGKILNGDAVAAERDMKAVLALIRAEGAVTAFLMEAHAAAMENDEDALRAELARRLALYAEADRSGAPAEVLDRIARDGVA